MLEDFGNPKKLFSDPKKGRNPQLENRCINLMI